MTRGPQRGETEPVEVEFETEEVPQVIFIGLMRFSVMEFVPKPMRC